MNSIYLNEDVASDQLNELLRNDWIHLSELKVVDNGVNQFSIVL